jgi:DNA (cytosine-5)-methyltransferase 1
MAVEAYFDAETIWCAEIDKHASKLISQRFDCPNLGDIRHIDWSDLEPIEILTAGYPCQPFSHAGDRKGLDDPRHIFPYILEAISVLRPKWVVLENVRGHLSLGLKEVLSELAGIGYDARWEIIRASDAGAPHKRERLFIVAHAKGCGSGRQTSGISWQGCESGRDPKIATDSHSHSCEKSRRTARGVSEQGDGLRNGQDKGKARHEYRSGSQMARQEIPNTLDQLGRLNPQFVEYMMGLPKGWVTDMDIARTQQLKMLGNGVVPQQAHLALERLMSCG